MRTCILAPPSPLLALPLLACDNLSSRVVSTAACGVDEVVSLRAAVGAGDAATGVGAAGIGI